MGEVWLAATTVDGRRFVNLFAARLPRDLELREIDLGYTVGARLVTMDAACTAPRGSACHVAAGLPRLRRRGGSDSGFQLWSLVQLEEEGWTLLGEVHPPRAPPLPPSQPLTTSQAIYNSVSTVSSYGL